MIRCQTSGNLGWCEQANALIEQKLELNSDISPVKRPFVD